MLDPSQTGSPLAFLSLMSRTAASKTLAEILEAQGIRVSSIYFGPLSQHSGKLSPSSRSINKYVETPLDSLVLSRVSSIHNSKCFSRSFGTSAGLQLSDIV